MIPAALPTRRLRTVTVLVAALILIAVASSIWRLGSQDSFSARASWLISLIATTLSAIVAATTLLAGAHQRRIDAARPLTTAELDQWADSLSRMVQAQWRPESNTQAFNSDESMPIRWSLGPPALMDHLQNISRKSHEIVFEARSDVAESLHEAFSAIPSRRIVITGGPGTGKTTLAIQLVLSLLNDQKLGIGFVPVFLSLGAWDPERWPTLWGWIIEQLKLEYPSLQSRYRDYAYELVTNRRVLPVLDGLDEVETGRAVAILRAVNSSLGPGDPLVVTCRRREYRELIEHAGPIRGAVAVGPFAISPVDAADYLRRLLPLKPNDTWQEILHQLKLGAPPELTAACAVPFGLWLIRTVYVQGFSDPQELLDSSRRRGESLKKHLLDRAVDTILSGHLTAVSSKRESSSRLARKGDRDSAAMMRRWLTCFAEHLRDNRVREWTWWDLPRQVFTSVKGRLLARCLAALVTAALGVVAFGIYTRVFYVLADDAASRAIFSASVLDILTLAFLFGAPGGVFLRFNSKPRHIDLRLRGRWANLWRAILAALGAASLSLILSGLVIANLGPEWDTPADAGSSDEFSNVDLIVGICLFVGLPAAAIAVIAFIASSGASEGSATPDSSFRSDRKIAIVKAVCFGALMLWTIGPTLTRSAYGAFTVAVIAQRLRGKMPLRPTRVLHEAYRLGLLRTVGPAYQFRHAELQDHLAPPRSD